MIRLQIVHLLLPHGGPNILAQKLNHVQLHVVDIADTRPVHARGVEARPIS